MSVVELLRSGLFGSPRPRAVGCDHSANSRDAVNEKCDGISL